MKGQVLSIYLHRFLLRSLSLELLKLGWSHSPLHSILHPILHHYSLRVGLSRHSLSLSTAIRCQLLSVDSAFKTWAFRRRRCVVGRRWRLWSMSTHLHVRIPLHLLHHLQVLSLLVLRQLLLLRARKNLISTSTPNSTVRIGKKILR